jgi:hypothetical protein
MRLIGYSLLVCFLAVSAGFARQAGNDPLTGNWVGDWGPSTFDRNMVEVQLKWDGMVLTGLVNPGPNAVTLSKTAFDPATGTVHMEANAKGARGQDVHFIIDGKVDKSIMSGSWQHDNRKGDFKITKK